MEAVYENTDFKHPSVNNCSYCKGNPAVKQDRDATPSKGTKVLLIVLCVSLALSVGGLCVLGVLWPRSPGSDRQLMGNYSRIKDRLSSCHEYIRSHSCEPCEDGWTAHDGKCYFFFSKKQTWFDSRLSCEALDAHLVIISIEKVHEFLVSKIADPHWIGLNDLDTEGRWVWVNNQTLNETGLQFWQKRESKQSEPDNWKGKDPSGENCAYLGGQDQFHTWCDTSCKDEIKFICEKKHTSYLTNDN